MISSLWLQSLSAISNLCLGTIIKEEKNYPNANEVGLRDVACDEAFPALLLGSSLRGKLEHVTIARKSFKTNTTSCAEKCGKMKTLGPGKKQFVKLEKREEKSTQVVCMNSLSRKAVSCN